MPQKPRPSKRIDGYVVGEINPVDRTVFIRTDNDGRYPFFRTVKQAEQYFMHSLEVVVHATLTIKKKAGHRPNDSY
jgi:hypothetical protein